MISLKYIGLSAIALAAVILLPSASSAAVITFDDRSAFESAVAGFALTEDSFDNEIPGAEQIVLDSGVVATNAPDSAEPNDNAVLVIEDFGSFYRNSVNNNSEFLPDTITWDFPMPVIGFGFELAAAATNGVQLALDGGSGLETFIFSDINGDVDFGGFVGFVADTAFETIVFSNANPLSTDSFRIDDLVFAEAGPNVAVPLPSTLPLTLFGIGALLLYRGKRSATASG